MEERMKDELWMKKIKERLEDYSEPLPVAGWERLEKDLLASKTSIVGGRRIIPFRRWAMSAAAVLLVAVSSVSLWLLQSRMGDEVRRTNMPALAVLPDHLPEQTPPSVQTDLAEPLYQVRKGSSNNPSRHSLVAQQIELPVTTEQVKEILPSEIENVINNRQVEAPVVTQNRNTDAPKSNDVGTKQVERRRRSGKDKLHLPVEQKSSSKSRGWSMGLSVGNTGGLGNMLGNDMKQQPMYDYAGSTTGRLDLSSTANGMVSITNGQELVFKNGLPYILKREKTIASIDHKQPLSFGFSVRKNLPKGFSVETGLTYTYLDSDVKYEGSTEEFSQKLHYLGIPVRANWNFVDNKSFTMYVSAGGAVEKCVYGKIGSKSETVKPLQVSVMGAVGAQYNVSNHVGVYVEPGVSYFFDDGSPIQTIRKENPCNFTLQAGVRLTY